MTPKPPATPGKNPTQKALQAYHSELRRYENELHDYELRLERWAEQIQEWADGFAVDDEDEDCDCGPQDALDGCPCPTCESWRGLHKATVTYERSSAKQANHPPIGDEIDWLVALHGLKDKRKK